MLRSESSLRRPVTAWSATAPDGFTTVGQGFSIRPSAGFEQGTAPSRLSVQRRSLQLIFAVCAGISGSSDAGTPEAAGKVGCAAFVPGSSPYYAGLSFLCKAAQYHRAQSLRQDCGRHHRAGFPGERSLQLVSWNHYHRRSSHSVQARISETASFSRARSATTA